MKDDKKIVDNLRHSIDQVEAYTPDILVWDAINDELKKTQIKGKRFHQVFLGIAASFALVLAVPLFYSHTNQSTEIEINRLAKQSQALETKISNISFNQPMSGTLKWKLIETENKLNTTLEQQEKIVVWRNRISILNDAITASERKTEFI